MIPQSDDYPTVIEGAIRALLENGQDAGRRRLIAIAYPIQELPKRPSLGRALMARVYLRDSFICRYCGGRTILTAVMELRATIYPDIFPFHPNWKGGLTHPAVISRSAVVDHVDPGAWGGEWLSETNLVTACWPCNARKGDLTLGQLGWSTNPPVPPGEWDGLVGMYPALWAAAGC